MARLVADDRVRGRVLDHFAETNSKISGVTGNGNCQRALLRLLPRIGMDLDGLITKIGGDGQFAYCIQPHVVLPARCALHEQQFIKDMGAHPELVYKFWCGLGESPEGKELFSEHGNLRGKLPYDLRRRIPLVMHEDGAPYSKRCSIVIVNISSLLSMGLEEQIKIVCAAYTKVTSTKTDTRDPAWKLFVGEPRQACGRWYNDCW